MDANHILLWAMQREQGDGGGERWDSARLWEEAGFLAFLQSHGVEKSDLLRSEGENGGSRRFFRCEMRLLKAKF